MDIATDNQQTISDDQELAKALAGVTDQASGMSFEETPAPTMSSLGAAPVEPAGSMEPVAMPEPVTMPEPVAPTQPVDTVQPAAAATSDTAVDPALASVKQDALSELRPLVDKLNVSPEERFDTYLLIIRSTDDKSLIAPAHEAAKAITDETRKAQALLDIIKEIDFLSQK